MLAEFLKLATDMAKESVLPEIQHVEGLPANRVWLFKPDGSREEVILPEPPLKAVAGSFATLLDVVAEGDAPEAWFCDEHVIAYPDRAGRPDFIRLPLTKTAQWNTVACLAKQIFDQKAFVRLLRIELKGVVPGGLLDSVKKVLIRHKQTTEGVVERQKVSVGKSLETEMLGDPVPDSVVLEVQVFHELDFHASLEAAVEIDLDNTKFAVVPFPGEVERAMQAALLKVEERLYDVRGHLSGEHEIYAGKAR